MSATDEAAAALAAMRESRERLAQAVDCPPQRHLAFAGLLGTLVAAQAAPPLIGIAIEMLVLVGILAVIAWDRRRTGMFINGYRAGATRFVTFALLAFALTSLCLGIWLKEDEHVAWAPLALGALVAVVAYYASALWQRIYLRELRRTP